MTAIQLLACAGMIVGVFLLLGMKPVEFTDSLFGFLLNPKRSLREDIRESSGRKKSGILRRELEEAQNILQMTGRGNRFSIICAVALALFCAGGSIAILLGNFFLAPVMAVGFLFLPFWYVKLTANHYKRDVSAGNGAFGHYHSISEDRRYCDGGGGEYSIFKSASVQSISGFSYPD